MTKLQIDYANLVENKRANAKREAQAASELAETKRSNVAKETLQQSSIDESIRHNQQTEALGQHQLDETKRSNLAKENETHRSNLVNEQIKRETLIETQRSNLARESENVRSNKARESETYRSNVAKENENTRSNVARETETNRANTTREKIDIGKAATEAANLAEKIRHDMAMESKDYKPNIHVSSTSTGGTSSATGGYARNQSGASTKSNFPSNNKNVKRIGAGTTGGGFTGNAVTRGSDSYWKEAASQKSSGLSNFTKSAPSALGNLARSIIGKNTLKGNH